MISRIRNKLGTAGLVISILALVAALGGAALAAGGLTKQQEKRVKQLVKQFSKPGPQGPAGPQGGQGPKGDLGAKGDTGSEGKPGADGTDGIDGEDGACSVGNPECTLPPGATLTGTWQFSAPAGGSESARGEEVFTNVSYLLRVEPSPEFKWIGLDEWLEAGETYDTAACPGSFENPEAAPGFVCFYAGFVGGNAGSSNRREPLSGEIEALSGDRSAGITLSFAIKNIENGAFGYGTWAVTAPTS